MSKTSVNRVAVVTGGASGMGEATCHELGRRGHQVAVLDVNADAAQRVTDDLRSAGATAFAVGADITDRAAHLAEGLFHRSTVTAPYRAGNTLLQTARLAGLKAPSSCETGSCGTCMAQVVEGSARMLNNDALDDDEIAEGWVVTCQALPTSRTVRVVYE